MRRRFERHLNHIALLHDAFMAAVSFPLALYLRLGADAWARLGDALPTVTLLCAAVSTAVFLSMRLYRGLWRYASLRDLVTITQAVTLALFAFYMILFLATRLELIPRSVPFIQWMLLLALLGGPRFLYRMFRDRAIGFDWNMAAGQRIPVLLVGAGDAGELFVREMQRAHDAQYRIIGIVEDDARQIGRDLHGVRIHGDTHHLAQVVEKLTRRDTRPQKIILTAGKVEGSMVRHLFEQADALGIPLARLPKLTEFKTGLPNRLEVQPIAIEDLLGRSQQVLDRESMRRLIEGKRVLVTGAGGTIGSELARQVKSFVPAHLVLLEQSEFALYEIDRELNNNGEAARVGAAADCRAVLGDIRNEKAVDALFAKEKPDIVFHAAAVKHVPIAEAHVEETVLTNVLGTKHIADACQRHHVGVMLLISTDKAVNPTSVMGATKRLAESYCQALAAAHPKGVTRYLTVRFGNVLGSTGSVVPLFQKQLAVGGPLTVTHPDMVRFFMTVREAVELVIQAAAVGAEIVGRNSAIFVLDMGQPVRILDLARQMIKLAGLTPDEDVRIEFTGLRPGEKLFEELFHSSEAQVKTGHERIMLAEPRTMDLKQAEKGLGELVEAAFHRKAEKARLIIGKLVPEYHDSENRMTG